MMILESSRMIRAGLGGQRRQNEPFSKTCSRWLETDKRLCSLDLQLHASCCPSSHEHVNIHPLVQHERRLGSANVPHSLLELRSQADTVGCSFFTSSFLQPTSSRPPSDYFVVSSIESGKRHHIKYFCIYSPTSTTVFARNLLLN